MEKFEEVCPGSARGHLERTSTDSSLKESCSVLRMLLNVLRSVRRARRRYLSILWTSMECHSRASVSQNAVEREITDLVEGVESREVMLATEATVRW